MIAALRRTLGVAFAAALVLVLAGCAGFGSRPATRAAHAQVLAPGVYMLRGAAGDVDAVNQGRTGNAGFVVGTAGVLVVDTGTSFRDGQLLLQAIAEVTPLPIRAVLVTHTRQEFLFGTGAFQQRGIPVYMHAAAARLMAARCENCLKTLRRVLGDEAMAGTQMFTPDVAFDAPGPALDRQLGELIGRPLRLLYYGHSSGPGDVALLDGSGVLFAGGLADADRIPDLQDSELPGWLDALRALRTEPVRLVVPGHGPAAPPSVLDDNARYLTELKARLATLLEAGASLSEVPDAAAVDDFQHWDQYDTVHRRNASILFLRLERAQLFK